MNALSDITNKKPKTRLSDWQVGGIVNCHRTSVKHSVICNMLKLSPSTVSTVVASAGPDGTGIPKKHSGAVPKLDERDQRALCRQIRAAPLIPIKKHLAVWCDTNKTISMDTFRKYMRLNGFGSFKAAHKPALSDTHKLKRLEWCLDKVKWTPEQWRKVVWSDESKFNVVGNDGGIRVIRKEGERYCSEYVVKTTKFGNGSVMLWGCFYSGGYWPLVALDGRNEEGRFILQEDGASCHTGRLSRGWKEGQPEVSSFSFWPAQSPDLNPIEHLWAILEKRIEGRRYHVNNPDQLLACIHEEWKKLGFDLAEKLVASMQSRCQEVIKARGGNTRY